MKSLLRQCIDRPLWIFVVILLATLPFLDGALHPRFHGGVENFFEEDDPHLAYYNEFRRQYGSDEVVVIAFAAPDIFKPDVLQVIDRLTTALGGIHGVNRVHSLTTAQTARGQGEDIEFAPLVTMDDLGPEALRRLRREAAGGKGNLRAFISDDGRTTMLLLEFARFKGIDEREARLKTIRKVAAAETEGRYELRYSGGPFLESEINSLVKSDNYRFAPIVTVVVALIILALTRDLQLPLFSMLNVVLVLIWGSGLLFMMGESLNSTTVIIGPILLAITFAASIHLLSRFKELHSDKGLTVQDAVFHSLTALWRPVLLTALTTAVGYFSFLSTSIRPVKILGLYTGFGVLISFVLTVTFLPSLLLIFYRQRPASNRSTRLPATTEVNRTFFRVLERLSAFTIRRYREIGVIFAALAVLTTWGMTKLTYNTQFITYLWDDNEVKQDILFIENRLGGIISVEMVVEARSADHDFNKPESIALLEQIQSEVVQHMQGRYSRSFSVADYFKEVHYAFNNSDEEYYRVPDKAMDIADYYELGDGEVLDRLVTADRRHARISFSSVFGSSKDERRYRHFVNSRVQQLVGDRYDVRMTGMSSLYGTMGDLLQRSQLYSFGTAFVLIFFMMYFVCRNIWMMVLSMVPNLFPIACTLGLMGWAGIPLDTSTVMIASVTMGIAVDDTIHMITWIRRHQAAGLDLPEAISRAFRDTGRPIVITTVVLFCAYAVLITGSVKPIAAFGSLAGLAIVLALVGDLFVLPALMLLVRRLKLVAGSRQLVAGTREVRES